MKRSVFSRLVAAGLGLGVLLGMPAAQADVIINAPIIIRRPRPVPEETSVIIEFYAPGDEWANISLNGRRVFQPRNADRRHRVRVQPGAYYLEVTGFDRFDVWSTGYLDVGRNDSNVVVVTVTQRGVQVSGDPYTWIPDAEPTRRR